MSKKKTPKQQVAPNQKTFKPMSAEPPAEEEQVVEVAKWDEQALVAELMTIEGMSSEVAEHMAKHGVPDDAYVVQMFYRISGQAAQAAIKVIKGK